MNTFSNAFRAEVVRMARKELRPELQSMRKSLASNRADIASLKREVKTLKSQLLAAQRLLSVPGGSVATEEIRPKSGGRKWEFKPTVFAAKRSSLGLTAKEMAKLVQASALSVYKWESGKVVPRAAHMVRIQEVLAIGKRKARLLLAVADGA